MALPILDFLTERMKEYDSSYEHRPGTAFSELFMQPLSLMLQPLRDEANTIQVNQSLKRILELDDPDSYYEDVVDEQVENFFVYRRQGSRSSGLVRIYYNDPIDRSFNLGTLEVYSTKSLVFRNSIAISITAQEMATQVEDDFFYFEAPFEAVAEGSDYNVLTNDIIRSNDPESSKADNKNDFISGANRETNTDYIARTQESIGVRDLNVGKGFKAIIFENFLNFVTEVQAIGMGDPEMMRDIVYNYHIGGRIDGYIKTGSVSTGEYNVLGLTIDPTRRLSRIVNILLTGTDAVSVGVQNLDVTENNVVVYDAETQDRQAVFYSYADLASPIDLSVNQYIRVGIDAGDPKNIKIAGVTPDSTQVAEIANRINVGLGLTVASVAVNPIVVTRRSTGSTPALNPLRFMDPTQNIFSNVNIGDRVTILVGDNKDDYIVNSLVSDNEIEVTIPYITISGAITFTNGSTAIAGVGTAFLSEVVAGDFIKKTTDGDTLYVEVLAVVDNDTITLASNYLGTTATVQGVQRKHPIVPEKEFNYSIGRVGTYLKILSPTPGTASKVLVGDPTAGTSALFDALGLTSGTYEYYGSGPRIYIEGVDYNVDLSEGTVSRIVASPDIDSGVAAEIDNSIFITQLVPFSISVQALDIISITLAPVDLTGLFVFTNGSAVVTGIGTEFLSELAVGNLIKVGSDLDTFYTSILSISNDALLTLTSVYGGASTGPGGAAALRKGTELEKDYRIQEVVSGNTLRIDEYIPYSVTNISYTIRRTGIKDNSINAVVFDFNPMTIDVGKLIKLDTYGRTRGIRPGREDFTITDTAFLYIESVELIDPISFESLGVILEGKGGFGRGGFGRGGFGVGSSAQYRLYVNDPFVRFSALEDSFIVIDTAYLGQSFRVTYKYVPEIDQLHEFATSDSERVLDADVLMKHFLPGVVNITAEYTTDSTNANTPEVSAVQSAVASFINNTKAGQAIDASDIVDVIYEQIDPSRTRRARVKFPIQMYATIYNMDNNLTIIDSTDVLQVPSDEIPPYTTAPLSPRIVHWLAGEINLTVVEGVSTGVI